MPKFTLIAEHNDMFGRSLNKITHECDVDYIGDVLENVDLFLRGAGFNPTGTLDYVEELVEPTMEDWDKVHSHHYFDTERNK